MSHTIPAIIEATSGWFGISCDDLIGRSRRNEFVIPRRVAAYLVRQMTQSTYEQMRPHFQRDLGTLHTGARKIEFKLRRDRNLAADIRGIMEFLDQQAEGINV